MEMILMTPSQRHDIVSYLINSDNEIELSHGEIAEIAGASESYVNRVAAGVDCSHVIYAIRCGEFVKYGMSTDVMSRLAAISTASPYPVWLAKTWRISHSLREFEASLHRSLKSDHHRNEWFFYRDWHFDAVDGMASKHNEMVAAVDWREMRVNTIKHVARHYRNRLTDAVDQLHGLLPNDELRQRIMNNVSCTIETMNNWGASNE